MLPFLVAFILVASASGAASSLGHSSLVVADGHEQRCQEITIPLCRGIGYNFTSMPNQFNHDTQDEAGLEVHQFWPLVEISCSEDLRFFLCSMYAPICIEEYQHKLPACRSVCERARHGCAPIMSQYGFSWPERMKCDDFPEYGDDTRLCMDEKNGTLPIESKPMENYPLRPEDDDRMKTFGRNVGSSRMNGMARTQAPPVPKYAEPEAAVPYNPDGTRAFDPASSPALPGDPSGASSPAGSCRCECRLPYFMRIPGAAVLTDPTIDVYSYQAQQQLSMTQFSPSHFNHSAIETAGGLASSCAVACEGAFRFSVSERESAFFWINGTALVCLATCLLTVLTFLTDLQRFHYPERAIIFLAGCYFFIAVAYLLRMSLGHSAIACDGPFIRYQKTGPTPSPCILSFILLYFFGMASAYWWLILTLTWFLAAGLKWSSEAITSYEQYFHLLAWLLPTIQSVTILCLGAIDADAFVGLCSVGNQSRLNLLVFVIAPLCICIAIGSMLLVAGFVALFRIRRVIRQRVTINVKTNKLEKLMMRIGVSSFLYIVPEVVVVGCHIYEYLNRPAWEQSLVCTGCAPTPAERSHPSFTILLLKYIMSLVIGITSGFWIWSGKTLESWMRLASKIICCFRAREGGLHRSRPGGAQLLAPNYYGGHNPMGMGLGNPMAKVAMAQQQGMAMMMAKGNGTPTHHGLVGMGQQHPTMRATHFNGNGGTMDMHTARSLVGEHRGVQHQPLPAPPLPPPPPPLMMGSHHGGSLTGSQFTHLMSGLNGKLAHV